MTHVKHATTDHQVQKLIAERWSPYAYANKPVARDDLRSLFEAARWAPSSYNEQPWYYIVAAKEEPEEYAKLLSCLVSANQEWARAAPVLALGVVNIKFKRNGRPNRHAYHDLGLASANLSLEASARGISVHQMAGILPENARELFKIPEDHDVVTGLAIGYASALDGLPETFKQRDATPRKRRPLSEFVFGNMWGVNHALTCPP